MKPTVNFLQETIDFLKENGKTPEDVLWVADFSEEKWMTWKEFEEMSNFQYDNDFGVIVIKPSVYVFGNDWWLERRCYGGSEWWAYKSIPKRPENRQKFELRNL